MSLFTFELHATDGAARAGVFHTAHGPLPTPIYAPVGTQATVKSLTPRQLHEVGAILVLANTYHLYLRPGDERVAALGGLHRFMGWNGPMLTDSGGFQVYSLAGTRGEASGKSSLRTIDDDGVTFRSHIDGRRHRFTPEQVMRVEENLGADIAMVLDECAPPTDYDYNVSALRRTHAWAERCKAAHTRPDQALFGIVQGGIFPDLREQSARFLVALDFPGYAIGGLSVGETKAEMHATLDATLPALPADKPRYLMGVGTPEDLVEGVARGVDIFDCVLPTRVARNGQALLRTSKFNMRNARFADDPAPIDPTCACYTCQTFSRAYVRHLIVAQEMLAATLLSIHNLHTMLTIIKECRAAILEGVFAAYRAAFWEARRRAAAHDQESQIES
ncbi:MAG TPA: tRNA guanosine(34) transglycosylase Tgt [Anaerolineae bacterium]|nr:tRNA guanosine(34) transglycosylase Tgt [Anaerolineae bacterium]